MLSVSSLLEDLEYYPLATEGPLTHFEEGPIVRW